MLEYIGNTVIYIIYNIPKILNTINIYLIRIINSLKEFIIRRYINIDYKGDINPPNPPNPLKVPLKPKKPFKMPREYKIHVDSPVAMFYDEKQGVPIQEVKYKTVTLEEFIKEFNEKQKKHR